MQVSWKKRGFTFIVFLLCFALCFTAVIPASAVELTEEQKETLDEKVERLKEKQNAEKEAQKTVNQIEAQIAETEEVIAALDARMADTKARIAELEEVYQQQLLEHGERQRAIYMIGREGYLEMMFSPGNFAELLTRIDQIGAVIKSDRESENAIRKTQADLKAGNESFEADKADALQLKEKQTELLAVSRAMLALQQLQYAAEKADADAIAQSLGVASIDEYIDELEWPFDPESDVSFRISSWFGPRESPGGIGSTYHEGIDIIPGGGTPIGAIGSGVVKEAGWTGGYGYCVVIEHGKNNQEQTLYSLYGHMMSQPLVSPGDSVAQGQIIGYVGSTGPSTGDHLHLEIWENKTPVDPMKYFERYRSRCVFM